MPTGKLVAEFRYSRLSIHDLVYPQVVVIVSHQNAIDYLSSRNRLLVRDVFIPVLVIRQLQIVLEPGDSGWIRGLFVDEDGA